MGTIIELFDGEQLHNVAAHLFFPEDRVVYLGRAAVMNGRRKRALLRFFEARGCGWTPEFIEVEPFDLDNITSAAEAVLAREPDCRLDITGGEELALVAMGALSERHSLPLVQVDPKTGLLTHVSEGGKTVKVPHTLTVSQFTLLYGGCVMRSDDREFPTDAGLRDDVDGLWKLCRRDRDFLNRAATQLNALTGHLNELYVDTRGAGIPVSPCTLSVLRPLYEEGFLHEFYTGDDGVRFSYRSETVKKLLTKAGLTLEALTRVAAENAGVFSDVRQGVSLDWDGVLDGSDPIETRNEVDALLIRGMTPVFISCKNGDVRKEALYELDVVAKRFGGSYARKALVSAGLTGNYTANQSLRQRARDMGVILIENVRDMTADDLSTELLRLR